MVPIKNKPKMSNEMVNVGKIAESQKRVLKERGFGLFLIEN